MIPVDLNALQCGNEKILAKYYKLQGQGASKSEGVNQEVVPVKAEVLVGSIEGVQVTFFRELMLLVKKIRRLIQVKK